MAEHLLFTATHCPACGKPYQADQVLYGWQPCRCTGVRSGGHTTAHCREDNGGCGHIYLQGHVGPPPEPERMPNFGQQRKPDSGA
jgi:hypothetical protein